MNSKKKKYYKILFLTGILYFIPFFLFAQSVKKSRILFLLDGSSSMTYNWNTNHSRFDIASNIILKIIDSVYAVNNEVEFAVRAYGTQFPAQEKNCTDTRLEVPFNIQNAAQINTRLKSMRPIGFSPIAYSLRQAAENELNEARLYDYSIIFITDGGESCNGDVCNTYKEFIEKRIKVKPYIIGLDRNDQLMSLYNCMGSFINVSDSSDIQKAIKMIVDANRPLLEKPRVLNIPTVFSNPPVIKNTEPVPVKEPEVKIVKSNNVFPRLKMLPYQFKVKEKIIFRPAYILLRKSDAITIRMNMEEEPKIVLVKKTDIFPKIMPGAYKIKASVKKALTAKEAVYKNNRKVTLHFDVEEPAPAIVRVEDVFPRLRMQKYPLSAMRSPASGITQPKKIAFEKNKKATLRFDYEEPVVRVNDVMPRLMMVPYRRSAGNTAVTLRQPKNVAYKNKHTAILHFEVEEKKKPVIGFIRSEKYPMRYSYAYRLPQLSLRRPATGTALLRFTATEPVIVKKKDPPPQQPDNSNIDFNIVLENSEETKVQVFFEGRNGKKYPNASPEILFKDITNTNTITSFRRQVSGGEPVPQKITAGKYNVIVTGQSQLFVNNVTITPNKLNKVTIKVTDGTLIFSYVGNRDRPVSEYNAIVNRRFAEGATVLQKCTDKLFYDPGTYYVEVNTLPASKFSIDMSFGFMYELQIQEPGTMQITNTQPMGNVQLQYEHGDKFEVFYNMNLNGSPEAQKLQLQPGRYKVIFPVDPKLPQMGTKIFDFRIKSNQSTLVDLK